MILVIRDHQTRMRAVDVIMSLDLAKPKTVEIGEAKRKRSGHSNDRYWAAVVTPIANYVGHTPEETHEHLKDMFCPPKETEFAGKKRYVKSTRLLSQQEFSDYQLRCEAFGAEYGVIFGA